MHVFALALAKKVTGLEEDAVFEEDRKAPVMRTKKKSV